MRMNVTETHPFIKQISEASGQDVASCYQCGKCTAGCPVAEHMDFVPNAVHRMIQYGDRSILGSSAIWLCVGCETCAVRCPNDIATSAVLDALKREAAEKGVRSREKSVIALHKSFLAGVQKRGRMHELSLILGIRLKSGGLFNDMKLGIEMFRRGKLSLFPKKIKNKRMLRNLFEKARRRT
ncbi:MAG: 4Fe-4S dicluster domain-containing protein [Acidobacteria bacterium]|nr:4Fe-4S dicluster domain-containing protein [Acidobacteriota bacterium]MBU4254554.1 4Fe-4S dicluster domain-containing protein [Acidobacteriota bacterium]